jgi:hypothetical protein
MENVRRLNECSKVIRSGGKKYDADFEQIIERLHENFRPTKKKAAILK